jgi:bacterioferritin
MTTTLNQPFLTDINELRRRARQDMGKGAVTAAYGLDTVQAIGILNKVLASELVCVLRYKRHYYMAQGIHADAVAAEFLQHATDEQQHVELVARRIVQLGGGPDFSPDGLLTRSVAEYNEGTSLTDMIEEDLVAERVVIMWYAEMARWFGDQDPTTRRLLEQLLQNEEEHADDLANLLADMNHIEGRRHSMGNGRSASKTNDLERFEAAADSTTIE